MAQFLPNHATARICLVSLAGLCTLPGYLGCSSHVSEHKAPGQTNYLTTLQRGLGGEPASLNPSEAVDSFSFEVLRDLYEGLTTESPDGRVLPGTAESWTVDNLGTRYTFQLRRDARWSNGKNVRAQDFVSAWRRVIDPIHASPVADLLRPIANAAEIIAGRRKPSELGVHAPTDNVLIVDLQEPAPYFPELLTHSATYPTYSEDSATTHNPSRWVSNGPYVLSHWTPGFDIALVKNSSYWDHDHVALSAINYYPISDESAELLRYRAGQLDITKSVPSSALAIIRRERESELQISPFLGTAYYALNLRAAPFRMNLDLRKAIAMAIDRKMIANAVLAFGQSPAYGFVPTGTWNYSPQTWPWKNLGDTERLAEARRLYSNAGYSRAKPLHLRLLYNSNPSIKQVAIAIAAMWKETLGVETELIDEEYRVFLQSRRDKTRWDVARLGWTADYNDAGNFLDTFRHGSANNDSGYANREYDDLLDRAAGSGNELVRRDLLEAAEKLMLSEYPIVPIYFYSSKRLVKPYVKGAIPNPLNRLYSKYLTLEAH
jgi:oligopeptide transport system substrate-binding protein